MNKNELKILSRRARPERIAKPHCQIQNGFHVVSQRVGVDVFGVVCRAGTEHDGVELAAMASFATVIFDRLLDGDHGAFGSRRGVLHENINVTVTKVSRVYTAVVHDFKERGAAGAGDVTARNSFVQEAHDTSHPVVEHDSHFRGNKSHVL